MNIYIAGTAHTKFGKLDGKSIYDLIYEAGKAVFEESPIEPKDIDGIWLSNFNAPVLNSQNHLAPLVLDISPDLRFKPAVSVENACASGMTAINQAINALKAGEASCALVIGVEKMTSLDTKGVTFALAQAAHWEAEGSKGMTFPGLFAEFAKGYMKKYGISLERLREAFAKVASKNHRNALHNPLAHLPKDISYEQILNLPEEKNPIVADPLRVYDCSLITDGAAAIILTNKKEVAKKYGPLVEIASIKHVSDYLRIDQKKNYTLEGAEIAINEALREAKVDINDISFAEVHDCFTIAEILIYEAMGLAKKGEGYKVIDNDTVHPNGKLPVNLSGGLKAKGHPVGATGVSMAVVTARQLMGKPIGLAVNNPKFGLIFNLGGSAATNVAAVFKRTN
jgi:acetyl-CoA C-acetyltransferase